jgi:hypothetical protein
MRVTSIAQEKMALFLLERHMLRLTDQDGALACTVPRRLACAMCPPLAPILATAPDCEELQIKTASARTLQTMELLYKDFQDELDRLDKPQADLETELHALALAHLSKRSGNLAVFDRFMHLSEAERLQLGQFAGCVGNQPFANLFAAYFMTLAARSLTEGASVYQPLLCSAKPQVD